MKTFYALLLLTSSLSAPEATQSQLEAAPEPKPTQAASEIAKEQLEALKKKPKESTASSRDKWRHMRNCTNAKGETFPRGSAGFHECMEELRKAEEPSSERAGQMPE